MPNGNILSSVNKSTLAKYSPSLEICPYNQIGAVSPGELNKSNIAMIELSVSLLNLEDFWPAHLSVRLEYDSFHVKHIQHLNDGFCQRLSR